MIIHETANVARAGDDYAHLPRFAKYDKDTGERLPARFQTRPKNESTLDQFREVKEHEHRY